MKNLPLENVLSQDELVELLSKRRSENQTVVFTNGVFDIIHPGHVAYLKEAKSLGDILVVGLNSDDSVKSLAKGAHRPIQDELSRASVLGALKSVDYVVVFSESTPLKIIESLSPDILVKGGDYSISEIVGSDHVLQNGGQVKQLQFLEGYSTSAIEQKIKNGG